tara:strand:+ start:242 stop:964 length:723 start_codon:yes stop_codon:yes gene_type:complete
MLKILVTGGTGMLGTAIKKVLPNATYLNGRSELDFTLDNAKSKLEELGRWDTIIHTAAFTDLNYNEDNPEKAYKLHSDTVKLLQSKCDKLVYISAQGNHHNRVYFKSKALGEKYTAERKKDLIIRANIYGDGGFTKWAVESLKAGIEIRGYSNVMFNPLSVGQLANFLVNDSKELTGAVNLVANEVISKYVFLVRIAIKNNLKVGNIVPYQVEEPLNVLVEKNNTSYIFNLDEGIENLKL